MTAFLDAVVPVKSSLLATKDDRLCMLVRKSSLAAAGAADKSA